MNLLKVKVLRTNTKLPENSKEVKKNARIDKR